MLDSVGAQWCLRIHAILGVALLLPASKFIIPRLPPPKVRQSRACCTVRAGSTEANVPAASMWRPPRARDTMQGGIPGPLIYVDMFRDARFVALFICNLVINFGYMVPFFYIPTYALSIGLTATGSADCPTPPSFARRAPANRVTMPLARCGGACEQQKAQRW